MTREEQIHIAAYEYCQTIDIDDREGHGFDYEDIEWSFEAGVKWADNNIGLSSIWNDINIAPSNKKSIVYLTKNGKLGVISQVKSDKWNWYVAVKYSIIKWAYSDDLLPKGGEK